LGPINVLIGPNGCGKSSLLQAIDFLRAFFQSSVEVYLQERGWDYDDLPNLRQNTKKISWRIQAQLDPDEQGRGGGRYKHAVGRQPRRYGGITEEELEWTPAGEGAQPLTLMHRSGRQLTYSLLESDRRVSKGAEIVGLPASFLSTLDPVRDREAFPEALHFRE